MLDKQLLTMKHMSAWQPTDGVASGGGGSTLVLDAKALENLEIFENSYANPNPNPNPDPNPKRFENTDELREAVPSHSIPPLTSGSTLL